MKNESKKNTKNYLNEKSKQKNKKLIEWKIK